MLSGITLILLGILAVPSLLLSKKPDAKEYLDKITPYQGWIGVVFCIWGLIGIFNSIISLGSPGVTPIWWLTWTAASVLTAALGFILGYNLIAKYVLSKNEEAEKKGQELLTKLASIQGKLGLLAVCLGAWTVVASFLFA